MVLKSQLSERTYPRAGLSKRKRRSGNGLGSEASKDTSIEGTTMSPLPVEPGRNDLGRLLEFFCTYRPVELGLDDEKVVAHPV